MLMDDKYRARIIRQIKNHSSAPFGGRNAGYDERFKREAIAPIQNKLGQFLLNPVMGSSPHKDVEPMVEYLETALKKPGVSKGRIKNDFFPGYQWP